MDKRFAGYAVAHPSTGLAGDYPMRANGLMPGCASLVLLIADLAVKQVIIASRRNGVQTADVPLWALMASSGWELSMVRAVN